jgi:hypothetical protein
MGGRFPILIKKLYSGELKQEDAAKALVELDQIKRELSGLPITMVIWDVENRKKNPPLGFEYFSRHKQSIGIFCDLDGARFVRCTEGGF